MQELYCPHVLRHATQYVVSSILPSRHLRKPLHSDSSLCGLQSNRLGVVLPQLAYVLGDHLDMIVVLDITKTPAVMGVWFKN